MSTIGTHATPQVATRSAAPARITKRTRAMLAGGVVAGPLFIATVVIQELTRDGFDPKRHPLSLLSLGDLGWIQITNFVIAGLLALVSAVGLRRVLHPGRAGTWGPLLIGVYGVGLIWGGVFVADPAFGYPVGTPDTAPEQLSVHGALHGIAPAAAALALIAACFVFARRFAGLGQRRWAAYCVATAVADIVLTGASFAVSDYRLMLAGGAIVWVWASVVTGHLMADAGWRG
jgi:Protein of unknown function (DUF998)